MMTNKPLIIALLISLLSASNLANASTPKPPPPPPPLTVTITDANRTDASKPKPTVYHWDQYATALSANIANPPVSNQETTVEGPHYTWGCTNFDFDISLEDEAGSSFTSNPSKELTAGDNAVPVTCTVEYTITNNDTGEVTHVSATGSIDVAFFVRVPVRVIQISNINGPDSPYSGPDRWGHEQLYHLEIQDNQTPPQPYGNGEAKEDFANIYNGPDPAGQMIGPNPNGNQPPATFPTTNGDFTDHIGVTFHQNMAAEYGWNVTTLVVAFDQMFSCLEPVGHKATLNTFHIENDYQTSTRN